MLSRIKSAVLIFAVIIIPVLTTGCTVIPTDISELESPPKLTADQQLIEKALGAHTGGKLTLKFPLEGDYRSAFVMRDLDRDGNPDAIAFYSPSGSNASAPHIAILDNAGKKNQTFTDIGSDGNEIDCIEFGDFNGDGVEELAVGWRSFNSTDLSLIVYTKKGRSYTKANFGTFTKMKTLDMDSDGKTDILLLKLDSNVKLAAARLISYKNGKLAEVSSTPLDSTVTSYSGVYVTKNGGKENSVIIDGVKSDNRFITEIVSYQNGRLTSPLYDNDKHTVNSTMRSLSYQCRDIDNDGIVEVPFPVELPGYSNKNNTGKNWLVRWSAFDGKDKWTTKLTCVMNYSKNYYFVYPPKWDGKVTIQNQNGDDNWTFCEWDSSKNTYGKTLFTISVYTEEVWNSADIKEPIYKLTEKNGTVYVLQYPQTKESDDYTLSISEIRNYFNLLN